MDLETAHRLSLIERNLEMAQTAMDSARELLRIVIEGMQVTAPPAPTPHRTVIDHEPVPKTTKALPAAKTTKTAKKKAGRPPKAPGSVYARGSIANIIREYVATQSGDFDSYALHEWAAKKGYPFNREQYLTNLNVMVRDGRLKSVSKTDKLGRYNIAA